MSNSLQLYQQYLRSYFHFFVWRPMWEPCGIANFLDCINPFHVTVLFLYPLKFIRNLEAFWQFQRLKKDTSDMIWAKPFKPPVLYYVVIFVNFDVLYWIQISCRQCRATISRSLNKVRIFRTRISFCTYFTILKRSIRLFFIVYSWVFDFNIWWWSYIIPSMCLRTKVDKDKGR